MMAHVLLFRRAATPRGGAFEAGPLRDLRLIAGAPGMVANSRFRPVVLLPGDNENRPRSRPEIDGPETME